MPNLSLNPDAPPARRLAWFVMHQENTVRAVILSDGFMLALRPSHKAIFFTPGGRIEPAESTRAALAREMGEELPGVAFEVLAELGLIEHHWREPSGEGMIGRRVAAYRRLGIAANPASFSCAACAAARFGPSSRLVSHRP